MNSDFHTEQLTMILFQSCVRNVKLPGKKHTVSQNDLNILKPTFDEKKKFKIIGFLAFNWYVHQGTPPIPPRLATCNGLSQ